MQNDVPVRQNFRLLSWLYAFSGGSLLTAVIVPFLQWNHLTLHQVFLLQGIYAAALLVGEIPTGYLSDRWGRRKTIILASVLRFCGMLAYFVCSSFWGFAIGEILLAFGSNCYSGTLDALAYDSLAEIGETGGYRKLLGHYRSLFFGSEAVTNIFGGLLAVLNLRAPIGATLVTYAVAILVSLMVVEPTRHKAQEEQSIKDLGRICRETVITSAPLRGIILLFGILSTMGLIHFWFTQPYEGLIELPLVFFGVTHAVIVGCGALAARWAYRAQDWIDDKVFIFGITFAIVAGFIGLGFVSSMNGLLLFVLVRVGWTLLTTVTNDLCNRLVSAKDRSTVLSIKAFSQRLLFALLAPVLGVMTDIFTINEALLYCGVVGGILAAGALFTMRTAWDEIPRA